MRIRRPIFMYATHGTRACYQAGCRCLPCRASNADYAAQRRTAPNSAIVDATRARSHLQQLAQLGIGSRRAAQLAAVSRLTIRRIRAGALATIRATIEARILAIAASLARGALIAGTKTWRTVDSLLREGFSRRHLAAALGYHSPQLHWNRRHVRVRSALRMAALYAQLAGQ